MRAMFDTNILVAAFATEGPCAGRPGGIRRDRGRDDLLGLRAFQRIRILHPRDFEALFAD